MGLAWPPPRPKDSPLQARDAGGGQGSSGLAPHGAAYVRDTDWDSLRLPPGPAGGAEAPARRAASPALEAAWLGAGGECLSAALPLGSLVT